MDPDHVTLIRTVYAAFARGDVPAVVGAFAPDIHWNEAEGFVYADGNPYVGSDAVLDGVFGRLAGEWENFTVSLQEVLATADGAVTLGRYTGTYKGTGRHVDAQFAHVGRIEAGKIRAFQQFTDTAQFSRTISQ